MEPPLLALVIEGLVAAAANLGGKTPLSGRKRSRINKSRKLFDASTRCNK